MVVSANYAARFSEFISLLYLLVKWPSTYNFITVLFINLIYTTVSFIVLKSWNYCEN